MHIVFFKECVNHLVPIRTDSSACDIRIFEAKYYEQSSSVKTCF